MSLCRDFICFIGIFTVGLSGLGNDNILSKSKINWPCERITDGNGFYWFAYYDKLQTDPTERYVLAMRVNFEGRPPTQDDIVDIGYIDLHDSCKFNKVGESRSWGWQQGCQLQFVPQTESTILWNDRQDGKFVTHIYDIKTKALRTIDRAVYAVSPDGKWAVSTDFRRLNDTRPGYGYAGIPDPNKDILAPSDSGIWKVDLSTGESKLIISIAQIAALPNKYDKYAMDGAKHWFNHLLISPDGSRVEFLHRWRYEDKEKNSQFKEVGGFGTRMMTSDPDGKNLRILDPFNYTSHFIWKGSYGILAWSRIPDKGYGFFLFEDAENGKIEQVGKGVMTNNGHNTYMPQSYDLVLNDTYPLGKERRQMLYIYNTKTGKQTLIAELFSPKEYKSSFRCDLHPRASAKGSYIFVDSTHEGLGRQIYMFKVPDIKTLY